MLARLEPLDLSFHVFHDCCFGLQNVQECLALVRFGHFFYEIQAFILLLQLLFLFLQLFELVLQFLFFECTFFLIGIEFLCLDFWIAACRLAGSEQIGTLWEHHGLPGLATWVGFYELSHLGLVRQWLKQLDVNVDVHLAAWVVITLEIKNSFDC